MAVGEAVFPGDSVFQPSRTSRLTTTTPERAARKSMPRPRLPVHQARFFWALCQEPSRSTTQRFVAWSGAGLRFAEIPASIYSPRHARGVVAGHSSSAIPG